MPIKTLGKPKEKKDFKQEFLEGIVDSHPNKLDGLHTAAILEDAFGEEKTQLKAAMHTGGMSFEDIVDSFSKRKGIDLLGSLMKNQDSVKAVGESQPAQPQQMIQSKPASSPLGFGGMSMQDGQLIEQKPGLLAGLLSMVFSGRPNTAANLDMNKLLQASQIQRQQQLSQPSEGFNFQNMQVPEGFEVVGYDQKGQPMVRKKEVTASEKASGKVSGTAAAESQLVLGKANILLDLFNDARSEAQSLFPNIGKEALSGKTSGFYAKQMGRVNKLPKVIAYQAKRKTFATTIAKAAGEVRPTDEDIRRFMEALPDISLPDETNEILLRSMYQELESQGAKNVWEKFGKGINQNQQQEKAQTFNIKGKGDTIMADEWDKYVVDNQEDWEQYAVKTEEPIATHKDIAELRSGKFPKMNILQKLFGISAEEQIAESQNIYAISKATGLSLQEVRDRNLTQDPSVTGMQRDPTSKELLQSQLTIYGRGGLIAGAITQPMALIKGLPGATIGYAVGKFAKPFERITPKDAPKQIKDLGQTADEVISVSLAAGGYKVGSAILGKILPKIGMGNYAKNKTLAVRKGAMQVYKDMQETYGKDLESLASNPEKVDPTNAVGKMEELINQRMPTTSTSSGEVVRTPPTNKVDNALNKAYDYLYGKWANSKDGKVSVGDVVKSLKIVKDSGGKTNKNLVRLASQTQGEILGFIKDDINVPKFQEMQLRYRTGMNELEAMDAAFDIWEDNSMLTKKGEHFVKSGIFKSQESQDITNLVTEKTGQTMKLGKASSRVSQMMANKILRYLVYGALAGGAAGIGFKFGRGRE